MAANRAIPARSIPGACPVRAKRGSRSAPNSRATAASGTLTANTARQPPTPISSPPSGGPTTAIVCVETASSVRIPAGLSRPVRCASRRMRYIAAG